MKFECYRSWQQLPASIDVLFERAGYESMFFTREWFEALHATAFEDGQSLLLASVVDEGSVLALLVLTGDDNKNWQSLSHHYTALYSLLLVEEKQAEIIACLVDGLLPLPMQSLRLAPVAENDSNIKSLQLALESSGYTSHRHFFFYNWIHHTHGQSFAQYIAERPAQLRNTITRKKRKLEREHECRIHIFKGDEVQQGLVDYHAAYSASWKAYEQQVALLDAVAIKLSVPGWTRLAVLYIDGRAAAAQLWFVVHGKASIFRLAYDEVWKHYSPGSILTSHLMQYVIDIDKVDEIDFLTGNEAYKQDWMSERRQRWRLLLVKQDKLQSGFSVLKTMLKIVKHKIDFVSLLPG